MKTVNEKYGPWALFTWASSAIGIGLLSLSGYVSVTPVQQDHQFENLINKPKFEINRKLFPYKSRYLMLENGSKIHYVDEGKGPTLL